MQKIKFIQWFLTGFGATGVMSLILVLVSVWMDQNQFSHTEINTITLFFGLLTLLVFAVVSLMIRLTLIPLYQEEARKQCQGVPLAEDGLIDDAIYTCIGVIQNSDIDPPCTLLQETIADGKLILIPNHPVFYTMRPLKKYQYHKTIPGMVNFLPFSS